MLQVASASLRCRSCRSRPPAPCLGRRRPCTRHCWESSSVHSASQGGIRGGSSEGLPRQGRGEGGGSTAEGGTRTRARCAQSQKLRCTRRKDASSFPASHPCLLRALCPSCPRVEAPRSSTACHAACTYAGCVVVLVPPSSCSSSLAWLGVQSMGRCVSEHLSLCYYAVTIFHVCPRLDPSS